jgi:hypothetical protein
MVTIYLPTTVKESQKVLVESIAVSWKKAWQCSSGRKYDNVQWQKDYVTHCIIVDPLQQEPLTHGN